MMDDSSIAIIYPTTEMALEKHDEIIEKSGGVKGVLNVGLLDSCLDFIRNDTYYPEFENKLAHIVFGLARNHAFTDGNKRTAIAVAAYFLEINSYDQFYVDAFMRHVGEQIILPTAKGDFIESELKLMFHDLLTTGELSDKSKLIFAGKLTNIVNS